MGRLRVLGMICAGLLAVCLLASCGNGADGGSSLASSGESPAGPSSEAVESPEESVPEESGETDPAEAESEESLPPPEAIVLLYTDYLTVSTRQDGLTYEYTYCFDAEQTVFNAIAVIRFPTEEAAEQEYEWLRRNGYPNLELEGSALSFCFPRKECPFYGISYRSLEVLLEETVYEIVDKHPPEPPEESIAE